MKDLKELLFHEIQDLYDAENQLIEALPKLAAKADSGELKTAFKQHLEVTKVHITRLKLVAKLLRTTTGEVSCMAMKGLIKEGEEILKEAKSPDVLDAGMIGAAQKVEHYEIAAYGTAIAHARLLGYSEAVDLLQQSLDEERAADLKLTEIAESFVNEEAAAPMAR